MLFHPKKLKSEKNNPWFKPWFNILLHTQCIICATVFRVLGIYNFEPTPKLVSHVVHVFQREVVEKKAYYFQTCSVYKWERPMANNLLSIWNNIHHTDLWWNRYFYDKKWLTASEILSISQLVHIVVIRSVLYC